MFDFKRIGGEIVSSPLNENFKQMRDAISISNTNLVFSETDGIKDTIDEMLAIQNPTNGQTCYVVSSGEFYRYSAAYNKWVKIMDVGQTFRQGFLNSGLVVADGTLTKVDATTLHTPNMLVYFKNQAGDDRYLKGMYLLEEQDISITDRISASGAYTLLINSKNEASFIEGMPMTDDPNKVFIGTFLVNSENEIIDDFIYTLPDIAYTADRGHFLLDGGQVSGCNLTRYSGSKVARRAGYYYDEGINYTIGETKNFPVDTDNGSNFNLKYLEAVNGPELIYITPVESLNHELTKTEGLISNKYWNGSELADVAEDFYTIQKHFITANGQNIIVYGDTVYNSMEDAIANLNSTSYVELNFPCVEATRIVVKGGDTVNTESGAECNFYTLERLAQAGTIKPEYADDAFMVYSGMDTDNTPSRIKFNLDLLQKNNFNDTFILSVGENETERQLFAIDKKFITNTIEDEAIISVKEARTGNDKAGYVIADDTDVIALENRVSNIEKEIWLVEQADKERYEQSVRYRLFNAEEEVKELQEVSSDHEERITSVENNKVNKTTKVNGYTLGDTTDKDEAKAVVLQTGDIAEGIGLSGTLNQWYTEARVSANKDVANATTHIGRKGSGTETNSNPHAMTTDDIEVKATSDRQFITLDEKSSIANLPADTNQALQDLDAKNLDHIKIDQYGADASINEIGLAKNIRFTNKGVKLAMADSDTVLVDCTGYFDDSDYMRITEYAGRVDGYVNQSIYANTAEMINGIEDAAANQYYGTSEDGTIGIHDISWVRADVIGQYGDFDITTIEPGPESIEERHLSTELTNKINNNYHSIYNTGELKSSEINTFNFGDNLTVSVNGSTATINATGGNGTGETNFANLADVDVVYTGNEGKALAINAEGTGIVVSDAPALSDYMTKSQYADPLNSSKVKKAAQADTASLASIAENARAVNAKSVDDTRNTNEVLWTAEKIISNTSSQIQNEGVRTYTGTTEPSNSIGKDGDIYALIEG